MSPDDIFKILCFKTPQHSLLLYIERSKHFSLIPNIIMKGMFLKWITVVKIIYVLITHETLGQINCCELFFNAIKNKLSAWNTDNHRYLIISLTNFILWSHAVSLSPFLILNFTLPDRKLLHQSFNTFSIP